MKCYGVTTGLNFKNSGLSVFFPFCHYKATSRFLIIDDKACRGCPVIHCWDNDTKKETVVFYDWVGLFQ
jgi:hypothetical protein